MAAFAAVVVAALEPETAVTSDIHSDMSFDDSGEVGDGWGCY